jgi:hypothetical protein
MWNVQVKVILVITVATGTISKSLRQYLSDLPGKQEIKELQTNSHIGHCIHTVESTNVKVCNIFHCEITLHVAQTVNTEQLQHYIP